MGMSGQCHVLATLPPGRETRYPWYRKLGGAQGQSGWVQIISPPPGFDPWTIQTLASHYTKCAIPALVIQHTAYTKLATIASSKLVYQRKPTTAMADGNSCVAVLNAEP